MTRPEISGISRFFIVHDAAAGLSFYRDQLGFEITFQEPAVDPFFGIARRDGAIVMLKGVDVDPLSNYMREPAARWDAYFYVPDPDALAVEFASRNVEFSEPLKDTHDGLRGFELKDCDGYVLFFGRPRYECAERASRKPATQDRDTTRRHAPYGIWRSNPQRAPTASFT